MCNSVFVHVHAEKQVCVHGLSVCGLEKPQKAFYECETLVKQVYLGQMGEQDLQLAGDLLPALHCCCAVIIRGLDNRC